MTSREILEVSSGLQSPFWKYCKERLLTQINEMRKDGSLTHVSDINTQSERDELLYGANALEQFVEKLPHELNDAYKQALEKEETHE